MEKGYKLHTLIDNAGRVLSWRLTPMNADEGRVCVRLLGGVPEGLNGYILGDGSYNDNKLFAAARVRGLQLVSPRRRPGTGLRRGETSCRPRTRAAAKSLLSL